MAIVLQGTPTVAEGGSTSFTLAVAYPSGIQNGEVLIANISFSQELISTTPPSGWQLAGDHQNTTANTMSQAAFYRVADGTESGSVTFNLDTIQDGRCTGNMSRWSGVDTSNPIDVAAVKAGSTNATSLVMPSITTVTDGAMLIHQLTQNSTTAVIAQSTGTTKYGSTVTGTGRTQTVAYEERATAGATGTRTWNSNTSSQWGGLTIALRPAGAGGGNVQPTGIASAEAFGSPTIQMAAVPALNRCVQGIPTATTHQIKVNTTDASSVRLKAGTDSGITTGVVWGDAITPDADSNSELTISGLTAGTEYYFRVAMTNTGTEYLDTWTDVGRFKTDVNGAMNFTVGFGSCAVTTDPVTFDTIATKRPDIFLHNGDEYYADGSGTGLSNFLTKMGDKKTATNQKKVYRTSPAHLVPSDHDGMNNNSTMGSDSTAWTNWNIAYRRMNSTQGIPATTGVWKTFKRGRVRFIALDRRSASDIASATDDSSKTCLGATQKQWFKDQIDAATEPLIIVQQAEPWHHPVEAGDDSWGGYSTERTELANYMLASGKKFIFLAGDAHMLAAEDGSSAPGGAAVFQAAPFRNAASVKGGPYDVGPYPASGTTTVEQYGWLDVTDTGSVITVAFTGYSADNTVRVQMTKVYTQALPTGIASAEAFGTPAALQAQTVQPSGIASAQAFGSPTVSSVLSVQPSGIASAQAFGSPTVSATLSVQPSGIVSAQAFGSPTVQASLTVLPGGIPSAQAFGTPSVTVGLFVFPVGIPSSEAFGTPTELSSLSVQPGGIASAQAFGTPTVIAVLLASPAGIASAETFGMPTIQSVGTVSPTSIPSAETFGTPTVLISSTVQPSGIPSAEAFGSPVVMFDFIVQPGGIASAEAFGSPTATAGLLVVPASTASAESFGQPVISYALTVSPTGIPSAEAFGLPTQSSVMMVGPTGIPSAESFGTVTVNVDVTVYPAGIASAEAFGNPTNLVGWTARDLELELTPVDRWDFLGYGDPLTLVAVIRLDLDLSRIEGEEMKVEIVASAGATQGVGGKVVERTGKDISGATILMTLGSEKYPQATWSVPDTDETGPADTREVMLQVGADTATPNGTYYVWIKLADTQNETVVARFPQEILVK